jgi:hypothetical protein
MLRKLLTYSTMTAVLLHAVLGCCIHHAHATCSHESVDESVLVEIPRVVGFSETGQDNDQDLSDDLKASSQFQQTADGTNASGYFEACSIEAFSGQPCSGAPNSELPNPHQSCDEADCNIVADQRASDLSLLLTFDWVPLLSHTLTLSTQEFLTGRMRHGSLPSPHSVQSPLRVQTQVWRL